MTTTLPPCILITGSSGGIGRALVELLLDSADFTDYIILGVDLLAPAPDVLPRDPRFRFFPADVSNSPAIDRLFASLSEDYYLTGIVNAAGVLHHGPALDCSPARLNELLAVNAVGVFNVCNAAARHMVEQDDKPNNIYQRSIVTIASNAATGPRSLFSAYGASKAFASHYTRSLGLEIASHGIRANVVCPGTTLTPMLDPIWKGQDRTAEAIAGAPEQFRTGIPLQKIAHPQEIAAVAAFLLTPAASHITLAELTVDGGATQR